MTVLFPVVIFFKHFIHLKPSEREAQLQGKICRHTRTARDVVNSTENGAIYDSRAIKEQCRPATDKPQREDANIRISSHHQQDHPGELLNYECLLGELLNSYV